MLADATTFYPVCIQSRNRFGSGIGRSAPQERGPPRGGAGWRSTVNALRVIEILTNDLGVVIPRAVTVARKANELLTRREPLDLNSIVMKVREVKLDQTLQMADIVKATTKHLNRVLTPCWFGQLVPSHDTRARGSARFTKARAGVGATNGGRR
jgi:hypothetical protein